MEIKQRILDAAVRVFAEAGFRGTTTRRIAQEADVNEVTLFRLFGSKDALLQEAMICSGGIAEVEPLPDIPQEPEVELTRWCTAHLEHLRAARGLVRKTMAEVEERPSMAAHVCRGNHHAAESLRAYMIALHRAGFVDFGDGDDAVDPYAAGTMLMSAIFADAMGRDLMPDLYPNPPETAAATYVHVFLRAIGYQSSRRQSTARSRAISRA